MDTPAMKCGGEMHARNLLVQTCHQLELGPILSGMVKAGVFSSSSTGVEKATGRFDGLRLWVCGILLGK